MKKLNISQSLTGIYDAYIEEALEMPLGASPHHKHSFWQKLSAAVNSPIGVACICVLVAAGVLAGIIVAGHSGSPTQPSGFPHGSTTPQDTQNIQDKTYYFDMSYGFENGPALKRGGTYNITTTITNKGIEFTYTGSGTEFFADATLIYHGGQTYQYEELVGYEIPAMFPITDDYVTKKIPTGETRRATGHFIIPDSIPVGQYDLKLSYKNEYVIFENAVTIYDEERFSFAYKDLDTNPPAQPFYAGGNLVLSASVTNIGESFMVNEDHSDSFVPSVKFVCRATGYTFYATTSQSDDITSFIVEKGTKGISHYFADIPEDADTGEYDLVLSYSNESRTFYQAIEVVRIDEKDTTEIPSETTPVPNSSEQEAIQAVLDYLTQQDATYPFDLREDLLASAYHFSGDDYYTVVLRKYLAGIQTDYDIRATVTMDGVVTKVEERAWSKDSYFLQYTDADVQAAIERIDDTNEGALYFEEENEKLYVCKEVIVQLTPPIETDENGDSYEMGGCGFDHDHVFYKEEVKHEN